MIYGIFDKKAGSYLHCFEANNIEVAKRNFHGFVIDSNDLLKPDLELVMFDCDFLTDSYKYSNAHLVALYDIERACVNDVKVDVRQG